MMVSSDFFLKERYIWWYSRRRAKTFPREKSLRVFRVIRFSLSCCVDGKVTPLCGRGKRRMKIGVERGRERYREYREAKGNSETVDARRATTVIPRLFSLPVWFVVTPTTMKELQKSLTLLRFSSTLNRSLRGQRKRLITLRSVHLRRRKSP